MQLAQLMCNCKPAVAIDKGRENRNQRYSKCRKRKIGDTGPPRQCQTTQTAAGKPSLTGSMLGHRDTYRPGAHSQHIRRRIPRKYTLSTLNYGTYAGVNGARGLDLCDADFAIVKVALARPAAYGAPCTAQLTPEERWECNNNENIRSYIVSI